MFETMDLILPSEAYDGPMQMALDESLLRSVSKPTLRIYGWSGPWVTFGYFQSLAQVRQAYPDLPLVRRWTGGGTVEHGRDITFSLMIPKGEGVAAMPPASFYRELHRRMATWLAPLLSSEIRLAGEKDLKAGPVCFSAPAGDDLLMSGRKILGGAQRRSGGALLYQGSLQGVEGVSLDPVAVGGALSQTVDQKRVGEAMIKESNLLAERRYRSLEWNSRR
jgi:lipoate-protein ligase A